MPACDSNLYSRSLSAAAAAAAGVMQTLQEKASEWRGVAASGAFAIDDFNVFKALGGDLKAFVDLSTNFYNRVYADEEWFRSIFVGSKEDAIQNQYEFFVQRMGGPPLYSQRKGIKKNLLCPF